MAKSKKAKLKKPIIILIIVLFLLAILATVFCLIKKGRQESGLDNEELVISEEIYGFTAEITEINGKTLALNGWVPKDTEPPSWARIIVKAVVTDKTEIAKIKFPEKSEQKNKETISPEKTPISFDGLKVGDEIHILAANNISENIKNKTSFNLKSIFITD